MTRNKGTYKAQSQRARGISAPESADAQRSATETQASAREAAESQVHEAAETPHRPQTKMVPPPNNYLVPERDALFTPVLECRHLGIDFGGLKAVDDLNLMVGKTEIAPRLLASSAPTVPARRPSSTCSPRSTSPRAVPSCSTARTRPAWTPPA